MPKNYQHTLALVYAIKEINENSAILPNITLGLSIFDNYYSMQMTYEATLRLLSTQNRFVPNYKCDNLNHLMAVIGGLVSETSYYMATVLNIYKIPQMTYGSLALGLSGKILAPSLYQMVPNEVHQYTGIVQLLLHFRWRWVGLFAVDDDNGERFLQALVPMLSANHICFDFMERTPKWTNVAGMLDLFLENLENFPSLMKSKANVFIVHGVPPSLLNLSWYLHIAAEIPQLGKVWITTEQWEFGLNAYQKDWDMQPFHGAISFTVHRKEPPGLGQFLRNVNPFGGREDGFIQDFWENAFSCSLKNSSVAESEELKESCTGEEKLETLPETFFEMSLTGHSYNVYNAAHAIAHAIHHFYEFRSKHLKRVVEKTLEFWNLQSWKVMSSIKHNSLYRSCSQYLSHSLISINLHVFLKSISFNNSAGETVHFDENGELVTGFDVTNWIMFPNQSFVRVKVGTLNPQAPHGKELALQPQSIVWHRGFKQVPPISLCNDHCQPGYHKKKKEGEPSCCYICITCPEGKISAQKGKSLDGDGAEIYLIL
ncbi:hypothetical protein JD844_001684 [Phrynosoma platyrhinos]|uniref:Vomeronasal type 2 receptor n=1 Tax=Phrynosoma platyrhinos TaxID=52577 RepID=A0ABQ7TAB9_PHRPL|nr:hypothetical protein JD844_001684 [Phrynosoma platyrhinos]